MEHQKSVQYLFNRREFYFATLVSLYAKQQHLTRSSTLAFSFDAFNFTKFYSKVKITTVKVICTIKGWSKVSKWTCIRYGW